VYRSPWLLLAGLALAAGPAGSATLTVCAAQCAYTDFQAALNAANSGDVIELKAGEVFRGNYDLPAKSGNNFITVRTSRYQELPAQGWRVNPAQHLALMPVLEPIYGSLPLVSAGTENKVVVGIDADQDLIAFDYSDGRWKDGTPLACRSLDGPLPTPLQTGVTYYARGLTGGPAVPTLQLALSPTGPPVDLTDEGGGRMSCFETDLTPHHYRFEGIAFRTRSGMYTDTLVLIGGRGEPDPALVPSHMEFRHSIFLGVPSESGPRNCLALNASDSTVEDSYLAQCKAEASEGHAVTMFAAPGPILIRNNYLGAAGNNLLVGGVRNQMDVNLANLTVDHNHIEKPGEFLYWAGDGPPGLARACTQGAFYRDVQVQPNTCENGACWVCQANGLFAQDRTAKYRPTNYQPKSGIEFKGCIHCLVENNIIDKVYAANDFGNASCFMTYQTTQDGPNAQMEDIVFRNNWCKDTWSGIVISSDGATLFPKPTNHVRIENVLMTGLGNFPKLSIWTFPNDLYASFFKLTSGTLDLTIDHVTGQAFYAQYSVLLYALAPNVALDRFSLTNSIMFSGTYSLFSVDVPGKCGVPGVGQYLNSPGLGIQNILIYGVSDWVFLKPCTTNVAYRAQAPFVSDTDFRLQSGSAFSRNCVNACEFAATDGRDLGVDMDELQAAISGVTTGDPSLALETGLTVGNGAVTFRRPASGNACEVHLYVDRSRLYETLDTSVDATDTRAGTSNQNGLIQFPFGSMASLVAGRDYTGRLQCGSRQAYFQMTLAAPSRVAR
jgi:hypothetical protein